MKYVACLTPSGKSEEARLCLQSNMPPGNSVPESEHLSRSMQRSR
jgi:hypothetical protein